ncbi:MAG: hypothetical protein K2P85_02900 [Flavobacteriaceae bacterium]|nr:hypothetical protein [Flavobacteriaceae bacterium]
MKKHILLVTVRLITLLQPTSCFAWGKKGHALLAEVAFNYLDPATRKVLTEYLDGMTIQDAANWMDEIKSHKTVCAMAMMTSQMTLVK